MVSAFVVFCACAITIPLLSVRYVQNATSQNRTEVVVVSGTTKLLQRGQQRWLAISGTEKIVDGDTIQTDPDARCMLLIYAGQSDYVLATAHVFSDTRITLKTARTPTFSSSKLANLVDLSLDHGRIRLNPGPRLHRDLNLSVNITKGTVLVEEGSVALETTADGTDVSVRGGRSIITVAATGEQFVLETGERASITSAGEIHGPLPAGRNLLVNGDFAAGLSMSWETYNDQGGDGGTVDGTALLKDTDTQRAVEFNRSGGQTDHCETGIQQVLRKDLSDYVSLRIRADIRLINQSLSGGGFQGSEFPLMIRLNYRDARGNLQTWTHGFYYQNPNNLPVASAEMIERDVWYAYESPDLIATLGDIKPAYIESIQVYSSGHDYQALVGEVQIVAE